ncbi:metal-sulfur cluster assembly factor [Paracoccus sp. S3-43]|uniref:metal-sulfur cluster assembly factor n=1 Tax=Paracoccus sp. S3-43 TaxID=3030011 RepID=UPI0023B0A0EB|nr:metal-sulfur cluster assembly factor [Paracoccus sp. S3-43]WEF24805.1 metal-sulfur cluster assembly factor [Paracoccus sp. S3-43]
MADLQDRVRDRLRTVLDPETGRDLLAMGMIYGIQTEGGHVGVQMTTTTRGCPLADFLRLGVETALQSVEGATSVDVRLVWEPAWTPDRMETL